jgi:tetratricopeptide (TPR) repeat protein
MKKYYLYSYLLTALVSFAVYYNSVNNSFVFDDESVVLGDKSLSEISNIPKYFIASEGFHKVIGRYYRPVVSTTYNIDFAIWGLNPFGFHLTNVIIHVINSVLFLYFLFLLFKQKNGDYSKDKFIAVLAGALLFAVHPVRTEAVAWISGRTDSLFFTFFITAFIYFFKYEASGKLKHIILMLLFYIFSLLSKEMAITFPVLVILYDIIVNKRYDKMSIFKNVRIYTLLICISILYLFHRWLILQDIPQRESYFYFYGKDTVTLIATMLQTVPLYVRLTLVPVDLLYHYNGYLPYLSSLTELNALLGAALTIILIVSGVIICKRFPLLAFSILLFLIALIPVMNIVPTMNYMAERFLYLPAISFSIIVSMLLLNYRTAKFGKVLTILFFLIIVLFSYMTISRNADWKDNDTLFMSAAGKPGTVLLTNIGNIFANKQQFDTAAVYYREALKLKKESVLANNNLGKIFMIQGNFDSAYYYIDLARKNDTLSPEPVFSLAQLYTRFNKYDDAIFWLEKLQIINPDYMNSEKMLEEVKMMKTNAGIPGIHGMKQNEITNKIMQMDHQAFSFFQNKQYDKAIEVLLEMVRINPPDASGYYNNIAMCYIEQNNLAEAEKNLLKAIELKDNFSTALNNLGSVYEKMGKKDEAVNMYKKALESDPNNEQAKQNYERLK